MKLVAQQLRSSSLASSKSQSVWRCATAVRYRAFTSSLLFQSSDRRSLNERRAQRSIAALAISSRPSIPNRQFSTSVSLRSKKTVDYLLADVGEGITECEIVKWFVEPGSHVEEFDVLVEVQSDKASVEITSRYTGKVVEHCYAVGQVARVGSPLCKIEMEGDEAGTEKDAALAPATESQSSSASASTTETTTDSKTEPTVASQSPGNGKHRGLATPAVRRITRENKIDIADVPGTGKDGRVTKEDVQQYLSASKDGASTQQSSVPSTSASSLSSGTTVSPLSGIRKAMFRGMTSTWTAPHFGYSDEVDVTLLDAIRKQLSNDAQLKAHEQEVRLTLLPFLLKALSIALDKHPIFRSKLNVEAMSLTQSEEHSLSIAFASPKGLLTPTLRGDVRTLSVIDIARQIATLQRNASMRNLTAEELGKGGTITLSNIGSIGGTHTFPLLPPTGQLIIGAVGRTRVLPRFNAFDEVVKASILPVSFSADHRVVEGVELARFVSDWKALLENPSSWLLTLR